jgi:hypothetical protein
VHSHHAVISAPNLHFGPNQKPNDRGRDLCDIGYPIALSGVVEGAKEPSHLDGLQRGHDFVLNLLGFKNKLVFINDLAAI